MEKKDSYIWEVTLDGRKVNVIAVDKLTAAKAAARALGVPWVKTAKNMEIIRLRRTKDAEI